MTDPPPKGLTSETLHSELAVFELPLRSEQAPEHAKIMTPSLPTIDECLVSRFYYLLRQSKALVETHGVYNSYAGTTVFSRAPIVPSRTQTATTKRLALSLAAAQDCVGSAQIEGPAQEDLSVFQELWDVTTAVLNDIFELGSLHHEAFGWGVYALSTGYMPRASWQDNSRFLSLQTRLHDGLVQMPDLGKRRRTATTTAGSSGGRVEMLAKANREIHICATLLLQQFQLEGWRRIRWYHAVAVAERWIEHLGL